MGKQYTIAELRKIIKEISLQLDLHHMTPSSRNGDNSIFNLFPFDRTLHSKWHQLFWNLTLFQVEYLLPSIHKSIFHSPGSIYRDWFNFCDIETASTKKRVKFFKEKSRKVSLKANPDKLRDNWIQLFGSVKLTNARKLVSFMLIVAVFGAPIYFEKNFFKETDLADFFNQIPLQGNRQKAFFICFPSLKTGNTKEIKRQSARTIRTAKHRGWLVTKKA